MKMEEAKASSSATRRRMRDTMSLSDLSARTPIVENIISMIPTGDDKAVKYAFYNVVALIVAGVSILALWAVYLILEPFIKSLLWALLCGSVLYPFKTRLVEATKAWLGLVRTSPLPFTVHLMSSPLLVADAFSERIGNYVWNYWKAILSGLAAFFVTYFVYHNPPLTLAWILQWIVTSAFSLGVYLLSFVRVDVLLALHAIYGAIIVHLVMRNKSGTAKKSVVTKAAGTGESDPVSATPSEETQGGDSPDSTTATEARGAEDEPPSIFVSNPQILRLLSMVTWFITFLYGFMLLPYTFMVPATILIVAGAIAYVKRSTEKQKKYTIPKMSLLAAKLVLSIGSAGSPNMHQRLSKRHSLDDLHMNTPSSPFRTPGPPPSSASKSQNMKSFYLRDSPDIPEATKVGDETDSSLPEDEVDGTLIDSNKFLYGVFVACVVVQVWNHLWLIHLLPIPVLYYAVKRAFFRFGIVDFIKKSAVQPAVKFYFEDEGLSSDLFPSPVRVMFRVMFNADRKLCEFCEAYLDPVASCVILVLVVLSTTLLFIFAATQVYLEGDHLVRVSVDLVNSTVSNHPEISKMLPEGWESMMGSMVQNSYVYGREYITNTIRDAVEEKDPDKAQEIEKQVIELWDKVYLSWNQTWDKAFQDQHKDSEKGSGIEWNQILETGKTVPQLLELSVLADYAKANVGTLLSLLESLWNILIGNVSVAISAVTAVLSVVFGGGSAIVNLMINFVVFFTALFYLLGSSTTTYKPVEMFSSCIPGDGKHSKRFLTAVEEAVNGVFTASFKMALFYGMWTWLIHTLFQINIVFVPSFLAALFGAVPLLMPYWAALPAVLELFLIQGEWTLAILMMIAQMAPMSMVDTQIYSEIKGGGHPYLTGLAVAGGIFYFGIQGAIMGPVILCCVFVAVKVGTSLIRNESEDEQVPLNDQTLLAK